MAAGQGRAWRPKEGSRMKKTLAALISLMALAALLTGCGGGGKETGTTTGEDTAVEEVADTGRTFTPAELAKFDGKDGRPAYVAVDGIVYDVTGSSIWPQGEHSPCDLDASAGRDLSEVLERAPARMRALIEAMPVVGRLAAE